MLLGLVCGSMAFTSDRALKLNSYDSFSSISKAQQNRSLSKSAKPLPSGAHLRSLTSKSPSQPRAMSVHRERGDATLTIRYTYAFGHFLFHAVLSHPFIAPGICAPGSTT